MAHDEALYRSICENPDDDALRLVYADWLEEHGDGARAEFIRVQIELAQIKYPFRNRDRWHHLTGQQQKLLHFNDRQWLGALADWPCRWEFLRGFPGKMIVEDFEWFKTQGDAVFAAAPVYRIGFRDRMGMAMIHSHLPELDSTSIGRFTEIDLSDDSLSTVRIAQLLTSLSHDTRWLNVAHSDITELGAGTIAAASGLTNLRELNISLNDIGTDGARYLIESPYLKNLQELHAHHIGIDYRSKVADMLRQRFGDGLHW